MPNLAKILLLLSASSVWQAISGYADVFSHRFVFKTFDPILNPAHISLYSASLVGLAAIWLGVRAKRLEANGFIANVGLRIALLGGIVEILSGILNEIYHQVVVKLFSSGVLHLAIHGLFVVSMFVVALGGFVASSSLLALNRPGSLVWSSAIFVSSIWLLTIGSVSYVTAFAGDAAGYAYLISGTLIAAAIATSALTALRRFGAIVLASAFFLVVNGTLIYVITQNLLFLPFSVVAAFAVELVWRRTKSLGFNGALVTGAAIGVSSYWLLYPYSFTFFDSGALPSPGALSPILVSVLTGVLGAAFGTGLKDYAGFVASRVKRRRAEHMA